MKTPNSLLRTLTLAAGATLLTVSAHAAPPSWIVPGNEVAAARLDGIRAKLGAENGKAIGLDKSATNAAVRGFGNAKATWNLGNNSLYAAMEAQVDDTVDLGHNFRKSTLRFKGGQNTFNNNDLSISIRVKTEREKMSGFRGGNNSMLTHGPIIGQVFRLEQSQYHEIADDGRKRVDPFVMEIDYDQDEFETTTGLTEFDELRFGCLYLGWLNIGADGDGSTASINDKWVNAIQGNFANWEVFANLGVNRTDPLSLKEAGIVGLNMSYEDYYAGTTTVLGANTKAANSFWVGDYGADLENNTMWAVIDHHSDYATVPEPANYGLLFGAVALLARVARRR
ncbi:MAG: hypothetical protein ACPGCS_00775 [Opitutales bacterium]